MPLTKNLELFYQHRPVADLTALAAVVTTGIVDGLIIEVSDSGLFKFELPAVATPDAQDVIAGFNGGNWIRLTSLALITDAVSGNISALSIADGSVSNANFERLDGGLGTVSSGVEDDTLFSVAYSAATRIFTVTYTAGAAYTVGGVRYTPAAGAVTTAAHANTAGMYYLYFDPAAGALTVSAVEWDLTTDAPLAAAYYNPSNAGGAADAILHYEMHQGDAGIGNATLNFIHSTIGTQLLSGVEASGYTINSAVDHDINWGTTAGEILDGDISNTITAQAEGGANTYRILYLTGTTASPVWNWEDVAEDGIYSDGTDIYWNENNAGTWQLTPKTVNNKYVNYYVVAASTSSAPQVLIVMGQLNHVTLAAATAATFADDVQNFGLIIESGVVVYKITYERQTPTTPGNARIRAFLLVDHNLIGVGVGGALQASNTLVDTAGFDGILSASDTDVQLALQTIDDAFPLATTSDISGAQSMTLNSSAWQAITDAHISLDAGTYLLTYSCSIDVRCGAAAIIAWRFYTKVVNTTDSTDVSGTELAIASLLREAGHGDYSSGASSVTLPLTITGTKVFQIYTKADDATTLDGFDCTAASIVALKLH